MSHVILNFIYRLRMVAIGRLRARGPIQKLVRLLVKAPDNFDRLLSSVTVKILDGVRIIPELSDTVESEAISSLIDGVHIIPEFSRRVESEVVPSIAGPESIYSIPSTAEVSRRGRVREGAVQKAVRYSSLAEGLLVIRTLHISAFLQKLQRSVERSLLTSALLSGVMTTLAFLFLALQVY